MEKEERRGKINKDKRGEGEDEGRTRGQEREQDKNGGWEKKGRESLPYY